MMHVTHTPPNKNLIPKLKETATVFFLVHLPRCAGNKLCNKKWNSFIASAAAVFFFSQRPREQLENLEVGDISQSAAPILLKKHGERKVRHPRNTKRHWKKISENLSFFLQKSIQFLSIIFRKGK